MYFIWLDFIKLDIRKILIDLLFSIGNIDHWLWYQITSIEKSQVWGHKYREICRKNTAR